jgi:beta-lactamase regulating signal transducer with metallopeptidase domain
MRTRILWLAVALILLIALVLYRNRNSTGKLNVEPHAAEEIEKARRR